MLFVLALYVGLQLALGLWIARRVRTADDFLLAGRSLGPVLATVSIFATWFGAETCVGAAGSIYQEGVGWHSTEPFAYGLCLLVLALFFASRLWRSGVTTVADLFAERFGHGSARLAALLMVPTSLLWSGAQLLAFAHVLAANSDGWFSDEQALWIAAVVVLVYTSAGGLLADVVTDLVQGVALVIGLGVLLFAVLWQLGGVGAAAERLAAMPARGPQQAPDGFAVVEAWAVPVLGSVAAQESVSRVLAVRSPGLARRAGVAGALLYVLVGLVPVALGVLGPLLVQIDEPEQLLPTLASLHMPPVVNMLFAGALVSAILSTVDSSLLAASAVMQRNLLPDTSAWTPARRLLLARLTAVGCGLAAVGLAHVGDSVSALVEEASGFGSAGIFVLFVRSLYGRRSAQGAGAAIGCLLAGVVAWVLGRYVLAVEMPFLLSLAASLGGYVGGRGIDRWRAQRRQ